jgi:hypothetical protein
MTDFPSCELVQRFMHEAGFDIADPNDGIVFPGAKFMNLADRLIQHGSDQELEACCEWTQGYAECGDSLRAARRPKPPSLKEQALKAVNEMSDCMSAGFVPKRSDLDAIRRALEALPE